MWVVALFGGYLFCGLSQAHALQWETGYIDLRATTADAPWQTFFLQQDYTQPPIVVVFVQDRIGDPVTVRVRNVEKNRFQAGLIEPPGSDGPHSAARASYIAMEPGIHTLPDGTLLQAGRLDVIASRGNFSGGSANAGQALTFPSAFNAAPAFFTALQTTNNVNLDRAGTPASPFVVAGVENLRRQDVELYLERAEVSSGTITQAETFGWIAIETGLRSVVDQFGASVALQVFNDGPRFLGHGNNCVTQPFAAPFAQLPFFHAKKVTRRGNNGGWARLCSLSPTRFGIEIDEDQFLNPERGHIAETISYLAAPRPFVVDTRPGLRGRVLRDDGAGGGVAHDAAGNGSETGIGELPVRLVNAATNAEISATLTKGDGTFEFLLGEELAGQALRIEMERAAQFVHIAEHAGNLDTVVNATRTDGVIAFTPVANQSYTVIVFSQVPLPRLEENQQAAVGIGATALFTHQFTAPSSGTAIILLSEQVTVPPEVVSVIMFGDTNCDGQINPGETAANGIAALTAGEIYCVIIALDSKDGAPDGATWTGTLKATFEYAGTAVVRSVGNVDELTLAGGGDVELVKEVRNLTTGEPYATANAAAPGHNLEYRIIFRNRTAFPALNPAISDRTPNFTALAATLPAVTEVPPGLTCAVTQPASSGPGYRGRLAWACTGTLPPGGQGVLNFRVRVDP